MNEAPVKMEAYGESVILIFENGKPVGFIDRNATVYECSEMNADDIARLIDKQYGVVARTIRKNGDKPTEG